MDITTKEVVVYQKVMVAVLRLLSENKLTDERHVLCCSAMLFCMVSPPDKLDQHVSELRQAAVDVPLALKLKMVQHMQNPGKSIVDL